MMRTGDESEREVARWLHQASEEDHATIQSRSLPTAGHLWWKAQIIRRLVERDHLAERATRPLRWSQWIGAGLGFLVLTLMTGIAAGVVAEVDPRGSLAVLFGVLVAGAVLPIVTFAVFWAMWRDT